MKQILLSGDGKVELAEVPVPGRLPDSLLVSNAYSIISTGTEGAAVARHRGWRGTLEKVGKHRDKLATVWQMARKQGIQATAEAVSTRLKGLTPLGYSSAGVVVETDNPDMPFKPGDRVACMGTGFATHSEYVVIPRNLAAPVPDSVSLQDASFGALGCIALQAIRRLELSSGECVGVIGLGLIGQLCVRLLKALGYSAVALDLDPDRVEFARKTAGISAWSSSGAEAESAITEFTRGRGLDGVIVAAASTSSEPLNLACRLCRSRGIVSIVGDVGLSLKRSEIYRKEIDVRISCSYGPGRYDDSYELHGNDYPLGHVRWTENRNLQLFLDLLADERLEAATLASQVFPVDDFGDAYGAVKAKTVGQYGVLFDYGVNDGNVSRPLERRIVHHPRPKAADSDRTVRFGLIGTGGYAKAVLVPALKSLSGRARFRALASRTGASAVRLARSVGAEYSTTDYREILDDECVDAVIIATRHSLHSEMCLAAIDAGKHVFVEKPLAVTMTECARIMTAAGRSGSLIQVGFNRRFAPLVEKMQAYVGAGNRRFLACRVNVGQVGDHWSGLSDEGGRLISEAVHFFDLANWLHGAYPETVRAMAVGVPELTNPDMSVLLDYPGGSVAQISYITCGSRDMPKERFELFGNGRSVALEDYRRLIGHGAGRIRRPSRSERGNKGQRAQMEVFLDAIAGEESAVARSPNFIDGIMATAIGHAAYEAARTQKAVDIADFLDANDIDPRAAEKR